MLHMQTIMYRMDKQQDHTLWHRGLYSIFCSKPEWKRIWKRILTLFTDYRKFQKHSTRKKTSSSLSSTKWKLLSHVWLFATPWTLQSMEFSRPEYWSRCLFLLQRIFSTRGLNPGLLHSRQILYQLSHKGIILYEFTSI